MDPAFSTPSDIPQQDNERLSKLDLQENEADITEEVLSLQKAAWELFEEFERKSHSVHSIAVLNRTRISNFFQHLHKYLIDEETVRLDKNKHKERETLTSLEDRAVLLSELSSSITTLLFQMEKNKLLINTSEQMHILKEQLVDLSRFRMALLGRAPPLHIQDWRGIKHVMKPLQKPLHFDPQSAHPNLLLSKNLKQVRFSFVPQTFTFKRQSYFDTGLYVLGQPGFQSGQQYWEVDVGHKSNWIIGVVKETVPRRGAQVLDPTNGFWVLSKQEDNVYLACGQSSPKSMCSPLRIGVFVDVLMGYLAFYDVDTMDLIFQVTGCSFIDKLIPFFCPGIPVKEEDLGPLTLLN
ncbi:nuclear factor 7, brain-like isoform X2 [Hyperolius riggenbachi]|uniref:nuclear factor 7, brain-like isoform X2 n=1 Tax=Hyperolius riggenbachi TaxID=752182 RepID=UPI0035A29055